MSDDLPAAIASGWCTEPSEESQSDRLAASPIAGSRAVLQPAEDVLVAVANPRRLPALERLRRARERLEGGCGDEGCDDVLPVAATASARTS